MSRLCRSGFALGACALALFSTAGSARTGTPGATPRQGRSAPAVDAEAVHAEMNTLFGEVERSLQAIDRLLVDTPTAARAPGKVAERLAGSLERGRAVQRGIDRILELADSDHHPPRPGGSGGT